MRRGLVVFGLAAWSAMPGCDRRGGAPTAPHARERADAAEVEVPAATVCTHACHRLDACNAELATAYQTDATAIGARFPFECARECDQLEGAARGELARVDDCTGLDSCIAFYTCATGDPPPMKLVAVTARTSAPTCASLCARERGCRSDGDSATEEEAEAACLLRCESAAGEQSPLPCASRRTCGGLVGCIDRWRDSGYASELDAAPPGVNPTCDAVCSRAIRCGAEATEELAEEELAELRDTMSSTYMECALQCGEDLDDQSRPRFEKCIAAAECEAFEECAQAL